jgi:hypothetical protein
MISQTSGAVPVSPAAWRVHAGTAAADPSCATRLSLVRGATGAAPCKAPVGGGVGGPRVVRGACAPPAGVVAPRPVVPEPKAPRDFPRPPLRSVELGGDQAAVRSAGRAAPDAADLRGLSVGRGAVEALASPAPVSKQSLSVSLAARASGEAVFPGSASLRTLEVTTSRSADGADFEAGDGSAAESEVEIVNAPMSAERPIFAPQLESQITEAGGSPFGNPLGLASRDTFLRAGASA